MLQPESVFLEKENDKMTDILSQTVSKIKTYSLFLNKETEKQNQNLEDMENQMDKSDQFFTRLTFKQHEIKSKTWIVVGIVMFFIWIITFLYIVPIHNHLSLNHDNIKIKNLIKLNAFRTFFWIFKYLIISLC